MSWSLSVSVSRWTYLETSILGFTLIFCLSPHLKQVSFPSPVSVSTPSSPFLFLRMLLPSSFYPLCPPSLSVYLSTFTVTALESQESKLPPSLSLPTITADPRFSLPLHLFPSQRLRFISLCVSGVWRVPFISPQGSQLCPVLVTHSHPPCPTLPLTLMNTYSHHG